MEKNRYLIQLLDVIRVLKGSEADIAKKHLIAYETNHTSNRRKMFQLYKYIKINDIQDYDKLKKKISPESTDDSFNKLIRRTTDRIQESLIIDVNIRRKGAYSDLFRIKFFLVKKNIQSQILMGRGLVDRPLNILNTCIREAKRYELYTELLESLRSRQLILANVGGYAEYKKEGEIIKYYENCRVLFLESRSYFEEFNIRGFTKSNKNTLNQSDKKKIKKIYKYYETTKSANILSYFYLLSVEVNKVQQDLVGVIDNTRNLIELIQSSPAVFSKNRLSYLTNELSYSQISILDFDAAILSAEEGAIYMNKESVFYLNNSLAFCKVEQLKGNLESCLDRILNVKKLKLLDKHSYYQSVFSFYHAIVLFGLGEFKKSYNIFSQKNEMEKDKEGWNVWIRIMRILCSIELLKLNMIDYDVESFRKYIQRIDKQYQVRERDKLVLSVLMELDKQSYDFETTALEKKVELSKLKSTDKGYVWTPDSPELILFHEWFEAKRLKRPYDPNFEVYVRAMKR